MKGLGKILSRYVLSAAGIALALIFLNVMIFASFVVSSFSAEPVYEHRLSELADSIQWTGSQWEAVGGSTLEGDYCWAMLLSEEGDILWSEALPEEQKRHYSISDAASFTRWYLNDYPVRVWEHEAGIFVIAQPRGSVWKQQMEMSAQSMDLLLHFTLPAFVGLNIAAALLMALVFGLRLFRAVRPVALGIDDLAGQKPVKLEEKGLLREISAGLNRVSEQLRRQGRMLQKRDRTRTEWIAGVSHDIRTPLTLVLEEAAQLEADEMLDSAARARAKTIRMQGERIRALVSDLNLASKLEYELQPLRVQRFRPAELLRTAAAEVWNDGVSEAFSLEMDIPADCEGVTFTGDVPLVGRAVRNLVGNSIRHNPQGCTITVGMRCENRVCRLTVADDGKGFPAQVLESLCRPQEGTISSHGLGLTIVRQIAAAHGGTFTPKNTETGTLVTLTFPRAEEEN